MSTLFFAFNYFDPLNGQVPEVPGAALEPIARRARHLLRDRKPEELDYALRSLLWMVDQSESSAIQKQVSAGIMDRDTLDYPERFPMSEAQLLFHFMDGFDITGQPNFDKASWPDYFATLALAHIGDIALLHSGPLTASNRPEVEKNLSLLELSIPSIIRATEAISIAESLSRDAQVRALTSTQKDELKKEAISLKSQTASLARWSKLRQIKENFIQFFGDQDFPTVAEAARAYFDDLSPEDRRIICPTLIKENIVRTFQATINKSKK